MGWAVAGRAWRLPPPRVSTPIWAVLLLVRDGGMSAEGTRALNPFWVNGRERWSVAFMSVTPPVACSMGVSGGSYTNDRLGDDGGF